MTERPPRAAAELDDQATIARIALGEADGLRSLYDRYGRMVYAISYRVVGEQQAAEECVQDVFLELWRHADRYDPERARVSTWLCTIARNRALDAIRRRERRPVPVEGLAPEGAEPDTADLVAAADEAVRVAEAMAELPSPQLEVLQLAHFDGLSQSEIAERLALPLGTVKGRMRLALQRMRILVEELAPDGAQ